MDMKVIAEIPARYGSKRVKQKNLRLLNGKPMIAYAIEAAKQAKKLDGIYVNSEHDAIGQIAVDYGVKFYKRSAELASDTATSEEFNYDFIKNTKADVLVMINPVSPLVEASDIDAAISMFLEGGYDSLISSREEQLQTFCDNKAVNFNPNAMLPRTQDISPLNICVWTVCVWNTESFVSSFEKLGYAVFNGKLGFFPMDPLKSIKVSYEQDFRLAETLLKLRENGQ